jgi:hypothetical protein
VCAGITGSALANIRVISTGCRVIRRTSIALARPVHKMAASRHPMLPLSAKHLAARRRTAMNTLSISDLAVNQELDQQTMRAMRGGQLAGSMMPGMPSFLCPLPSLSQFKLGDGMTIGASQLINQGLNITNMVGTNSAFDTGMSAKVVPHQSANNSITLV